MPDAIDVALELRIDAERDQPMAEAAEFGRICGAALFAPDDCAILATAFNRDRHRTRFSGQGPIFDGICGQFMKEQRERRRGPIVDPDIVAQNRDPAAISFEKLL